MFVNILFSRIMFMKAVFLSCLVLDTMSLKSLKPLKKVRDPCDLSVCDDPRYEPNICCFAKAKCEEICSKPDRKDKSKYFNKKYIVTVAIFVLTLDIRISYQ